MPKVKFLKQVKEAMLNLRWVTDFQGALTVPVLMEYIELYQELDQVVLQPDIPDGHTWRLSPTGQFSTKLAYVAMFQGAIPFEPAERVWKTWAPSKCKFFIWLVEHNRCWTADKLAKRGLDHPEQCPLYDQQLETINHLLVLCVFTRQIWASLLQPVGMLELVPQLTDEAFEDWWRTSSLRVQEEEQRKGFNSLVVLGVWVIWKHRNLCVFDGTAPSVSAALLVAREEALLWTMARATGLSLLQAMGTPEV
jgi:hypothetical protein